MKKLSILLAVISASYFSAQITTVDLTLSDPCSFNPLSTNDLTLNDDIIVYPNPAKDYITIKVNNSYKGDNLRINIFDMSGKLVLDKVSQILSNDVKIDTNQLISGMYQMVIFTDNKKFTKKIMINK